MNLDQCNAPIDQVHSNYRIAMIHNRTIRLKNDSSSRITFGNTYTTFRKCVHLIGRRRCSSKQIFFFFLYQKEVRSRILLGDRNVFTKTCFANKLVNLEKQGIFLK